MARCEVCANDYEAAFEVIAAGQRHVFDSFECAIHRLAPVCEHCGCRVIGHGHETDGRYFCCAHCAREATGSHSTTRGEELIWAGVAGQFCTLGARGDAGQFCTLGARGDGGPFCTLDARGQK